MLVHLAGYFNHISININYISKEVITELYVIKLGMQWAFSKTCLSMQKLVYKKKMLLYMHEENWKKSCGIPFCQNLTTHNALLILVPALCRANCPWAGIQTRASSIVVVLKKNFEHDVCIYIYIYIYIFYPHSDCILIIQRDKSESKALHQGHR